MAMSTAPTDEELMMRFAEGDQSAFVALLRKYRPQLMEFAKHMTRNCETAEDIVQEALLRVVKARDTYRPEAKLSTWLYTIVRNLCYDELRKHRRQVSLEGMLGDPATVEDRLGDAALRRPPPAARPDVAAARKELSELAEEAMLSLSAEHRVVIQLRISEGLGYAEIADRLSCSPGTAKSRMHYALKGLRAELLRRV
jgi:RNA polymerase sigma-70 factor (ECF subfamily)